MRHPYLDHDTCVKRLLDWHEKNGRIIMAFDFDNTVYDYHSRGHDYSDVTELLVMAKAIGAYLIVFTGNEDRTLVERYLREHEIPFDAINEQAPFLTTTARKIYYNLCITKLSQPRSDDAPQTRLLRQAEASTTVTHEKNLDRTVTRARTKEVRRGSWRCTH